MLSFLFQRPWLKAFSKALLAVRVKEFPPAKQLLKEIILFNLNIDRTLQWRILISYLSFNAIIQNNSEDVRVLFRMLTFLFLMWFTYILLENSFVNLSEKLLPAFHFSAFNWDPKARWAFCLKCSGKLLWLLNTVVGSSRNPTKEGKIETLSFLAFYNISITMLVLGGCHNTEAHRHNVKIKNTHVYNIQTLRVFVPLCPSGRCFLCCAAQSLLPHTQFSAWEWHTHTNPHHPHFVIYCKAWSTMGIPLCTPLYRAATLSCPHSGDTSGNTQVDREMVLINDEVRVFNFLYPFSFFLWSFCILTLPFQGYANISKVRSSFCRSESNFCLIFHQGFELLTNLMEHK